MISVRNFSETEIAEMNRYVTTQVPHSMLPGLFVITEEPIKKIKIFVAVYRILQSASMFLEKKDSFAKMKQRLEMAESAYNELYPKSIVYDEKYEGIGQAARTKALVTSLLKHNSQVNSLTNEFLVFAEKQELIRTEDVAGLKLEEEDGMRMYQGVAKLVE